MSSWKALKTSTLANFPWQLQLHFLRCNPLVSRSSALVLQVAYRHGITDAAGGRGGAAAAHPARRCVARRRRAAAAAAGSHYSTEPHNQLRHVILRHGCLGVCQQAFSMQVFSVCDACSHVADQTAFSVRSTKQTLHRYPCTI